MEFQRILQPEAPASAVSPISYHIDIFYYYDGLMIDIFAKLRALILK